MLKIIIIPFVILCHSFCMAQNDIEFEINIKDRRFEEGDSYLVTFLIDDSTKILFSSDTGTFSYKIPKTFIHEKIKVQTEKLYSVIEVLCQHPGEINMWWNFEYDYDIQTIKSKDKISLEIGFNDGIDCATMPSFTFNYNKADSVFLDDIVGVKTISDEQWYCIASIFEGVDTIKIRPVSDIKEMNPQELAEKRAEIVKENLLNTGIINSHIKIMPLNFENPLISEEEIAKLNDPEEIKAARRLNVRVYLSF